MDKLERDAETKKSRSLLLIIAILIVGVFVALIIFENMETRETLWMPKSSLIQQQTQITYEMSGKLPVTYFFEDIDYGIDVPSRGLLFVEGGYVYTYPCDDENNVGLIVAELSAPRTISSYVNDVVPKLYAIQSTPVMEVLSEDYGYINGYEAQYSVVKLSFADNKTVVYAVAYLMLCGDENVFVCATTDNATTVLLEAGEKACKSMIKTLIPVESEKIVSKQINVSEDSTPVDMTAEEADVDFADNEVKEAAIDVDKDYENLRVSFLYMDISKSPNICEIYDSTGKKYPIDTVEPGRVSFLIGQVSAGDVLTVRVTAEDLKGCTVEQIENAEYLAFKEGMDNGNHVHVEEGMGEDTEDASE